MFFEGANPTRRPPGDDCRSALLTARPGSDLAQPYCAFQRFALIKELRGNLRRESGKGQTVGSLEVTSRLESKDCQACPVEAPHFRYPNSGENWKPVERV